MGPAQDHKCHTRPKVRQQQMESGKVQRKVRMSIRQPTRHRAEEFSAHLLNRARLTRHGTNRCSWLVLLGIHLNFWHPATALDNGQARTPYMVSFCTGFCCWKGGKAKCWASCFDNDIRLALRPLSRAFPCLFLLPPVVSPPSSVGHTHAFAPSRTLRVSRRLRGTFSLEFFWIVARASPGPAKPRELKSLLPQHIPDRGWQLVEPLDYAESQSMCVTLCLMLLHSAALVHVRRLQLGEGRKRWLHHNSLNTTGSVDAT